MRHSQNHPGPQSPLDSEPTPGKPDPGTQNGLDGCTCLIAALESALSVVQERVGRLEGNVRNLQSQNANRS